MVVFGREMIYEHMNNVHDAIHDEEIIHERVNYDEQQQVLLERHDSELQREGGYLK